MTGFRILQSAQAAQTALVSALLLLSGNACKHAPPAHAEQTLSKSGNEYHLHRLIPYTMRVRRPAVAGANAKAGPGGIDYRTDPLPDAHFDCNEISWLFRDVKLAEVRACIARAKSAHVLYVIHRLPVPYLELEEADDTPPCLKSTLPTIPLPREIFFQSNEGERLACYSTRLAIEANEVAGFKMPIDRTGVKLEFPMATQPKDDEETRMLLMTWALTPFWESSSSTLLSHLVPDGICVTCLGERTMLKPSDPEPQTWPD